MKNIFLPVSKSQVGKVLFYIFEFVAYFIGFVMLVLAIYSAVQTGMFYTFISGFVSMLFNMLVIYGIGRIIDLLFAKRDGENNNEEQK